MSKRRGRDSEAPERLRFSASIPGGAHGPLWKLSVEALTTPETGGGERLRLRAHIETNLASVARPAIAAMARRLAATPAATAMQALGHGVQPARPPVAAVFKPLVPMTQQARSWLQQRMQAATPALTRITDPLLNHDLATWFEMELSSAPLVAGAQALLPHADKLDALGIKPQTGPNAAPVQAWQGQIGDELAQVSLLRLDDRQLPENLRKQLGGKPFQIAAALVNVAKRRR